MHPRSHHTYTCDFVSHPNDPLTSRLPRGETGSTEAASRGAGLVQRRFGVFDRRDLTAAAARLVASAPWGDRPSRPLRTGPYRPPTRPAEHLRGSH